MKISAYVSATTALIEGGTPGWKHINLVTESLSLADRKAIASICAESTTSPSVTEPSLRVQEQLGIVQELKLSLLTPSTFLSFIDVLVQKQAAYEKQRAIDEVSAAEREVLRAENKIRTANEHLHKLESYLSSAKAIDLIGPMSDERVLSISKDFYIGRTRDSKGYIRMSEVFKDAHSHPELSLDGHYESVYSRLSNEARGKIFAAINIEDARRIHEEERPARIMDAVVAELGTESQKERHQAGVLPEEEQKKLLGTKLLSAFADFPRYERIMDSDFSERPHYYEGELKLQRDLLTELTEDQFNFLKKVGSAVPESSHIQVGTERIRLYYSYKTQRHTGFYQSCRTSESEPGVVRRDSLRVTVSIEGTDIEMAVILALK